MRKSNLLVLAIFLELIMAAGTLDYINFIASPQLPALIVLGVPTLWLALIFGTYKLFIYVEEKEK